MTPDCPGMLSNEYLAGSNVMSMSVLENAVHFNLSGQYAGSWGNGVAPYWQARGLAALNGMKFIMDNTFASIMGPSTSWLAELPTFVEATDVTSVSMEHAAIICEEISTTFSSCWHYPFECPGLWLSVLPAIQTDSRAALSRCVSTTLSNARCNAMPCTALHTRFELCRLSYSQMMQCLEYCTATEHGTASKHGA